MKTTPDFFVLCQSSTIDNSSGSLSLFNLIEGVAATEFPVRMTDARVVSRYTIENSDEEQSKEVKFFSISPDGRKKPITSPDGQAFLLNYQPNTTYQKSGIILNVGIEIEEAGIHKIKAFINNKEIASLDFIVNKQ